MSRDIKSHSFSRRLRGRVSRCGRAIMMKKLFKFTRRKTSTDASDSSSIVSTASDISENEKGKFHKAPRQSDTAELEQLVKNVDVNVVDKYNRLQPKQKLQEEHSDNMEISEEFDELTSSSYAVMDEDNPFKMKLDDIGSQQDQQATLRPTEHQGCAEKLAKLKEEKAQLKNQLEEAKDDQRVMKHKFMQMQSELSHLRSSKQQQERLEEELRQTQVQLSQQRCAIAQLQQKLKSQDCKQQTMEEDYMRTKHNEEHLRTELENSSTKQRDLLKENEDLKEELEDLRQDLRLTKDNQAASVLEWNNVVTGIVNDRLETEALRSCLAAAEHRRAEAEKALLQEQQQLKDKHAIEMDTQRKLSQKLSKAKAYGSSMKNKVEMVEAQLTAKNAESAALRHEMDQIKASVKESQKECVAKEIAAADAQRNFTATQKQLQAELADLTKKLSKSEADLEVQMRYRKECEEEKSRLHKKVDKMKEDVADAKMSVKQQEEVVHRQRALLRDAKRRLRDHQASDIEREKNKQQLENERRTLTHRPETNTAEHVEQDRREIEENVRPEIQQKIHETKLWLQSQEATQAEADQTKATTEASLQSKIQDLEGELQRARSIQQEKDEELKRCQQMLREEQSLRNDLQRANSQLSERCKSVIPPASPIVAPPSGTTVGLSSTTILNNPVLGRENGNLEAYKLRQQFNELQADLKKVVASCCQSMRTRQLAEEMRRHNQDTDDLLAKFRRDLDETITKAVSDLPL
ncbi:uncharacterized protein LOC144016342 isoform X2 [Festucalex cinctus]